MKKSNLSYEFLIESYKTNQGQQFSLSKTNRKYFKLDIRTLSHNSNHGTHYISHNGTKKNLIILEGDFNNEFISNGSGLYKKTFLIFKNEIVIGVFEIYTHDSYGVGSFDWIHFFVKRMNNEELRLTLEHALSKKLGSNLISIRDQIIHYISSKPIPSFERYYF